MWNVRLEGLGRYASTWRLVSLASIVCMLMVKRLEALDMQLDSADSSFFVPLRLVRLRIVFFSR